jgi:CPA2 family monovalent cation:H+ antiporter-2
MHSSIALLNDLAVVLGLAALTTVLALRLWLPPVFGYLVAGVLIGPTNFLPLVADVDTVRSLSELGVILLMFSLGLGFTIQKIDGRSGSRSALARPDPIDGGSGTSARRIKPA